MNLRLHDDGSAKFLCSPAGFIFGIRDFAARYANSVARENLLCLVLMNLQCANLKGI
jgi:hypothetical protein